MCAQCRWHATCATGWRAADHLSLVAFMRTDHREALESSGITTVAALAGADSEALPRSIGRHSRERLVAQARLQLQERATGVPAYELLEPAPGIGLQRLPTPDPGDLYLDFEGDPYVEPAGREYLAGLGDRSGAVEAFWAHSADEEKRLTEQLIDRILAQLEAAPRHARLPLRTVREECVAAVDVSTRGGRGQARRAAPRGGSRRPVRGGAAGVADQQGVVLDQEAGGVLLGPHPQREQRCRRRDVERGRLRAVVGGAGRHHPGADPGLQRGRRPVHARAARLAGAAARRGRGCLRRTTPPARIRASPPSPISRPTRSWPSRPSPRSFSPTGRTCWPVSSVGIAASSGPAGGSSSGWRTLDEEELIDDGSALGGLGEPVHVRDVKQSHVHRYSFPPQDTKLRLGRPAIDIDTTEVLRARSSNSARRRAGSS